MKLTSFTDYSLRVLIYLATEPDRRATIAEIAAAFDVSVNHLTKVVHLLGKAGLLVTVRGKGGGMGLARDAKLIGLGEVVRLTEGPAMPAECFDAAHNACPIAGICRLQRMFGEAVNAFHAVLDQYTLQDLVRNRQALARVMFEGRAPRRAATG